MLNKLICVSINNTTIIPITISYHFKLSFLSLNNPPKKPQNKALKDIAYKTLQFKEKYIGEYHKEPTIEIISKELNIPEEDIVIALEAIQEPISIYTPIYNNGSDEIYLIDQIQDGVYDENNRINQIIIDEGLKRLNPRLKSIIVDRYFNNKTQMEIAEEIGISQAQVSRLEKTALKIIKEEKWIKTM